jgi:hypothetical protein
LPANRVMSFRPRKLAVQQKTDPSSDMFSPNGVIDFKSGVVFDPDVKGVACPETAAEIRKCVTNTMLKAVEPDDAMRPLSVPVDDIERTVRIAMQKHIEQDLSARNSIDAAVQKALAEHMPRPDMRAQNVPRSGTGPALTRSAVELAVRSALSEHMPRSDMRAQNVPRSDTKAALTRSVVEKAVRSALSEHMPRPDMAAPSEYNRVQMAVRNAVEKHIPRTNAVPTYSARGNQMRDVLY